MVDAVYFSGFGLHGSLKHGKLDKYVFIRLTLAPLIYNLIHMWLIYDAGHDGHCHATIT